MYANNLHTTKLASDYSRRCTWWRSGYATNNVDVNEVRPHRAMLICFFYWASSTATNGPERLPMRKLNPQERSWLTSSSPSVEGVAALLSHGHNTGLVSCWRASTILHIHCLCVCGNYLSKIYTIKLADTFYEQITEC